jgi:CBS domain-containing protein
MTGPTLPSSLPISALIGDRVARVGPRATLHEVADAMAAAGVGALVVGDLDQPSGIVTERDLAGALAARLDPATTRAGDIAHTSLVWCDAEATVAEVATEMMTAYVRHVLVEEDGRLVGVVSARDLLGAYASDDADATVTW